MKSKPERKTQIPVQITIDTSKPGAKELLSILEGSKTATIKKSQNKKDIIVVRMTKCDYSARRSKTLFKRCLPVSLGSRSNQGISRHSYAVVLK